MQNHQRYIHRCLQLAKLGEYYVAPNPMVGAVLVYENTIIGEGWHQQYGGPHAEPNCLLRAEQTNPEGIDYKNCTLYVSLEPCSHYGKTPPCAELIIKKGIGRVVIGTLDPNPKVAGRGVKMMQEAGIEVYTGILEKECRELNKRFFCLQEKQRPYIILKWAETADGYIDYSRKNGNPLTISTALTKLLVHQQRAENMAIMVGTNTVLLDNPRLLTTRWSGKNPIRITLDRHHILPSDSKIFSPEAETIVYDTCTDWQYITKDLGNRNIHSVLVEGGAKLLQHILDTNIYDEVHIEVSNKPLLTNDNEIKGVKAPVFSYKKDYQVVDDHLLYTFYNQNSY